MNTSPRARIDRARADARQVAGLCHDAIDQGQACARPQQVAALARAVEDLADVCAGLLLQELAEERSPPGPELAGGSRDHTAF